MRRTGVSLTQRNPKKNGPESYGEVDPRNDFSGEVVIAPEVRTGRCETVCMLRIKNHKGI